jgi:hypothetical protein
MNVLERESVLSNNFFDNLLNPISSAYKRAESYNRSKALPFRPTNPHIRLPGFGVRATAQRNTWLQISRALLSFSRVFSNRVHDIPLQRKPACFQAGA